jgi:Ca2+-binding EF-hand superfamily protein
MYRQLESAAMAIGGPDWTELFGRLDKDSSGVLSLEELREAVRGLFRLPESVVPDGMVEAFFRAVDRDGSGGIVLEELVRFMSERKTQQLVHGCLESAAVSLGGPDWSVLMGRLRKGNPLEVSMEAMREAVRSELGVTQAVLPDKALESVMQGLEGSSEDRVSMRGVERFLREKQVLRTIDGQLEAAVLQLGGTEISELLEGVREEWSSKPMGLTDVKGMLRDAGLAADVVTDEAIELMFEYVDREGRGQIELRALEAVLTEQRTVRGMYRQLESAAMAIGVLFRASMPCPCHCVFTCLHAQCE